MPTRVSIVCLSRAVGAQAEKLNRVLNLGVTVRLCNRGNPLFQFFNTQILGSPAIAAHQVVVMRVSIALAIQGLALAGAQDVNLMVFSQCLEVAINRRQADLVPARGEVLEDLLRAAEVAVLTEVVENRLALLGHSLHGDPFIDEAYVPFFVSLAARGGGVGLVRARGLGMISGGGQCAHPLLAAEVVA